MNPLLIAAAVGTGLYFIFRTDTTNTSKGVNPSGYLPPPQPVPPPPAPQRQDPTANAIDPAPLGISIAVNKDTLVKINAPVDILIKQSDGSELAAVSLLIWFSPSKDRAIVQWMPPVDIDEGGYFKETKSKLVPGNYYYATTYTPNFGSTGA